MAVGVLALLAGCGTADPVATSPVTSASSSPARSTPPVSSDEASPSPRPAVTPGAAEAPTSRPAEIPDSLRFTATTVEGAPFDGAELAGQPVLLWFWAPWCPTCRGQIEQVQDLAETYADRVQVVGVGSLDDAEAIKRFAGDATGVTHLVDEQGTVWKHFGVVEQSSFVLLDAQGAKVVSTGYGGSDDLAYQVADVA